MTLSGTCWNCGQNLKDADYGRQESCERCGRDTHVCRNCTFYDVRAHNLCRENQADRVLEKERANFCDYFDAAMAFQGSTGTSTDVRAAAEALFKKK